MVGRSRLVDGGSNFVGGSCLVCWSQSMVRRSSIIVSLTRVSNISNISTVAISYIVVNSLSATIRKSYTIGARGRVTITGFIGLEVSSIVVIMDAIFKLIDSRFIVGDWCFIGGSSMIGRSWFMVRRDRSMVRRSRTVVCTGKGKSSKGDENLERKHFGQ